METEGSILGNAVLRREDATLLRGEDPFLDDVDAEGAVRVVFVRSTIAHGEIVDVDTTEARAVPGVVGVYTAADLGLHPLTPMPMVDPGFARPPIAHDRVRFVGDIIAAVAAETLATAVDAAELVIAEIESFDHVLTAVHAMDDGAPLLFPAMGTNVCFETGLNLDEDPVRDAHQVVSLEMTSQRLAGVPMEPNGALAVPEDGRITLWIPSQNPIVVRDVLLGPLGLSRGELRVTTPTVGGGFGSKAGAYVEFVLVAEIARRLGRPAKWIPSRSEDMVALNHGRGYAMSAKLGITDGGAITGLDVVVVADAGSYPGIAGLLTTFTQHMIQGVYDIPRLRYRASAVVTNTTTIAAYRGAGRPEATQLLERLLDVAADETGLDPVEIRKRNLIAPEAFPVTTHTGAVYDSGSYGEALDAVLLSADYTALLNEQATRRSTDSPRLLGIGLATYVEVTAPGNLGSEYGSVEVLDDGSVVARVGTSPHGQGHITAYSMIIADALGISMDRIAILHSDTDLVPRGMGTMGSRSMQIGGSALHTASTMVRDKARSLAAHILEASPADIVLVSEGMQVAGVPATAMSWSDLVRASHDETLRPIDMAPGLAHDLDFESSGATYPFGAHLAVVEVDRDTGRVELHRHVSMDDCGTILNPVLVAGQQHGGIGQGAAQALFEEVRYDEYGNPITASLLDYALPSPAELPSFEINSMQTPTERNPLGVKGIGESGTIGSTPAIHNAVIDAVSHLGVRHIEMPLTPGRVWRAIRGQTRPSP